MKVAIILDRSVLVPFARTCCSLAEEPQLGTDNAAPATLLHGRAARTCLCDGPRFRK